MNFMANESAQKLRGGYYTPADLAAFITRWIAIKGAKDILEPSCGDGAFFDAISRTAGLADANVTAFELDPEEARKAAQRASELGVQAKVHQEDFLGWAISHFDDPKARFDAVIGNPPFVRYQYLPDAFQARAESIFRTLDCKFTKHTNAWVPFVLASMMLLKPGGRLAMVIPSEIFHVMHAQSLRTFLGKQCRRLVIIDPEEIWFEGTLQGAVILLAEKGRSATAHNEGLGVYSVSGRDFVHEDPEAIFTRPEALNGKTVEGKWTRAFLTGAARSLFQDVATLPGVSRFSDIAKVDVGIVTGANKFFLVDNQTVSEQGLAAYAHPMFGRSGHCPGIIYDRRQHDMNAAHGYPTQFLWLTEPEARNDKNAREYIALGEKQGLHQRFKCRVRSPWYTVPSVRTAPIGMLKRAHETPRLILNELGAYTTDTAYRITPFKVDETELVVSFLNPLTALSAELEGRHYGGGVLELVPSEIEKLVVPISPSSRAVLRDLDTAVRTKPAEAILRSNGSRVLGHLGLTQTDIDALTAGWLSLKRRRHREATEDIVIAD
jgi:adenine-specific DNA-methyltransferase